MYMTDTRLGRDLILVDQVENLKRDHIEIRRQLWILSLLVSRGDFDLVVARSKELQSFLNAHFSREESSLRDVIAATSLASTTSFDNREPTFKLRVGALDSLIQKHKAISESFEEFREITMLTKEQERFSRFDKFQRNMLALLEMEEKIGLLSQLTAQVKNGGALEEIIQLPADLRIQGVKARLDSKEQDTSEKKAEQSKELVLA
jgi:hypothetical protein